MENTQEDSWMGTIPSQKDEGRVSYYLESMDDEGKLFTTEIYELEVKDMPKVGIIKVLATYGTLFAFILGIGLIFFIDKRSKIHSSKTGMMILGASLRLSALRGLDDIKGDQERLRRLRKWIVLALLIATIMLIIAAITKATIR